MKSFSDTFVVWVVTITVGLTMMTVMQQPAIHSILKGVIVGCLLALYGAFCRFYKR